MTVRNFAATSKTMWLSTEENKFTRPKAVMRYMKESTKGRDATPDQRPWQYLPTHPANLTPFKNEDARQRASAIFGSGTGPWAQSVCYLLTWCNILSEVGGVSPTRKWASFRSCVRMKLCGRVRERFSSCWDGRTQDSLWRSLWPRVIRSTVQGF